MFTYYKTYKELGKKLPIVYEAIDLGLPSGTLWATMNVGAYKPSDTGLYFQWGDTVGYTADQVGKDKQFNWDDYKFSVNGSSTIFSKYTTPGATLKLEDDAAHVNMGGDWHMPTLTQFRELIDNTTSDWTTQDGVNGRLFKSKTDPSKFIFFPATGNAWYDSVNGRGSYGDVWSSTLNPSRVTLVPYLHFNSDNANFRGNYRVYGFSVRGVIG